MSGLPLALAILLLGQRVLPPESIVPAGAEAAAAYYEQLGDGLFVWGAYPAALANYRQSLERQPDRLTARISLARTLAARGDGLAAFQAIQGVLAGAPENPAANRLHAELLLASGQREQAALLLQQLVDREETDALAWRLLGLARLSLQQLPAAEQAFRRAIKLRPFEISLWRHLAQAQLASDHPATALASLRRYCEARPDDVETNLVFCELLLAQGLPNEAVNRALRVYELEPDNPRLVFGIATTLEKLRRRDQAAEFHERALKLTDAPPVVLGAANFLAEYHAARGRFGRAADYLQRIITLRPALLPPRLTAVKFHALAGDWRAAAAGLRGLVALQPNNLGFRMQLLDYRLRARDWSAARETARDIVRRWPTNPALHQQIVQGFLLADRDSDAINLVEGLRRELPDARTLSYLLEQLYLKAGRPADAERLMAAVHRRYPDDPLARHELAAVAYRRQQWDRVVTLLEPLVDRRQLAPEALFALAWSEERLGRHAAAAQLFELLAAGTRRPLLLMHVARQYDQSQDFVTAARIYERLLAARPKHLPALIAAARANGNAGNIPRAEDLFRRAVALDPANTLARRGYALALVHQGQLLEAREQYRQWAAIDPSGGFPDALAGDLEQQLKGLDAAIEVWLAGLERAPAASVLNQRLAEVLTLREDYPAALARWTAVAEADALDFRSRGELARLNEQLGQFDEARRWRRDQLALTPRSAAVYGGWLADFSRAGLAELGVESALQYLRLVPDAGLHRRTIDQFAATGELDLLRRRVDDLLADRPADRLLADLRGLTLARDGDLSGAAEWYRGRAASQPTDALWPRRLSEVLGAAGQPGPALAAAERARDLAPGQPGLLAELTRALVAAGFGDRARATARQLIALDPRGDAGYAGLIDGFRADGQLAEARLALRELLAAGERPGGEAYRQNAALLTAYASVCEELGELPEAARSYELATRFNPFYQSARRGQQRIEQRLRGRSGLTGILPTAPTPEATDESE